MTGFAVVVSAVFGATVGSFLNACIHRMPLGISLANPRRSFCPSCNRTIPWHENLPVLSWLLLRGKCSGCGASISPRYVLVEVLTLAAFVAVTARVGFPLAPVYWVFVSLLIVATFIDIAHFIIPDEITWGGTVAGVVFSAAFPAMMKTDSHWVSLGLSVAGAALGFGLLWLVVEGGKLAFGRKRHTFDGIQDFEWVREGDRADLKIGDEVLRWEDVFSRESDVLLLETTEVSFADGRELPEGALRFFYNKVVAGELSLELDSLERIRGKVASVTIPREAMGFGDVKFIACIGAFLGWQAVLFTLLASSVIGSLAAVAGLFIARDRAGTRVPFGPFLALGAVIWFFAGREITAWYFSQLGLFVPSY